jgi:inorganic pyrophosphatase
MHYPCNYGYVPRTLSGDGDPVDVLVISPFPLITGVVVRCRPVGMLRMEDEAGDDTKVLAVPIDKLTNLYRHIESPRDVPEGAPRDDRALLRALQGSRARQVGQGEGWVGAAEARKEILDGMKRYKKTAGKKLKS